jgi:membrane protease YdiL (CAAX protease family)
MRESKGEPIMNTVKQYPLLTFYGVALLFSGVWEGLYVIYGAASPLLSVVTLFLASYGPTVGTLFALALLRDADETRAWRRRLLTFRANWRWYVLAVLLPALAWLAGTALTTVFGGHFPFHPILFAAAPLLLLANTGEEIGWRGFALPRLLSRFNSLTASLILGVMWSLIHLPLYSQVLFSFLPFLFLVVALSIVMTWVFNHTGSVPLMVVMHASLDTTTNFVSPPNETVSTIAVFALSALVMWLIALIIMLRTGPDLGRTGNRDVAKLDNPLPAQTETDD